MIDKQFTSKTTEIQVNKHLFVWLGNFCFGFLGLDRFMRGQIGIGIMKILFGWMTLGIWVTVDWIISLIKAYSTLTTRIILRLLTENTLSKEMSYSSHQKYLSHKN